MSHGSKTDSPSSYKPEISPDSMMGDFRGKPIVAILIFTVVIHAVFIGVFSIGYLKRSLLGEDTSSMTEDERMDIAVREGTAALRKIAERHDVSVQDLSDRFSDGKPKTIAPPADTAAAPGESASGAATPPADAGEEPDSEIERELLKKEEGPAQPALDGGLEDEDDLFAQ